MNNPKSLLKNFIYNSIFTILNLLFPIITLPYVSRIIGADGIGRINFSNSIMNYFLIVASLGIPLYGVREIAKVKNDDTELGRAVSEILIINFISTIICITAYYLMVNIFGYFKDDYILFLISGISLFLNIFNLDWFYQGLEEYKYITFRSAVIKIISIISMFFFVKDRNDYIIYALINVLALSGNNLINILNLKRFVRPQFKSLRIKRHLKSIMVLLSIQVAVNIYINLDTTMIGILADKESVGYYSNAIKINKIIVSVITSISTILLPRLSEYVNEKKFDDFNLLVEKAFKFIIYISVPAMIGVFFLSEPIIIILSGKEFVPAINTMRILVPLILVLGIGNLFGTQVLMPLGKEKKIFFSVFMGALINFIINLILIPKFKQNGAAISTIIAESTVMICQVFLAFKYLSFKVSIKDFKNNILSNLAMILILLVISISIKNLFVKFILSVLSGAITYLSFNILLKDKLTNEVISRIMRIKKVHR